MSKTTEDCCTPAQAANYFLTRARKESVAITPMKLLKLVYIGYGWCLTLLGRKLFKEKIEAWQFGPVIPSLYHEFKSFGPKAIDRFAIEVEYDDTDKVKDINIPIVQDPKIIQVLEKVWQTYKEHSAYKLSSITHHRDSAWDKAWKQAPFTELEDSLIIKRSKEKIEQLIAN